MRSAHIRRKDAGHGSPGSYLTAFWLVMAKAAPAPVLLVAILVLAAVQIGVYLRCFLNINGSAAERWNLIALILAIVIVLVVVVGSLCVVYELNYHMMPSMTAGG